MRRPHAYLEASIAPLSSVDANVDVHSIAVFVITKIHWQCNDTGPLLGTVTYQGVDCLYFFYATTDQKISDSVDVWLPLEAGYTFSITNNSSVSPLGIAVTGFYWSPEALIEGCSA